MSRVVKSCSPVNVLLPFLVVSVYEIGNFVKLRGNVLVALLLFTTCISALSPKHGPYA